MTNWLLEWLRNEEILGLLLNRFQRRRVRSKVEFPGPCYHNVTQFVKVVYEPSNSVLALKLNNYDAEPLLKSCGISISNQFTQVEGHLKVGNGEYFFLRNGRWNFNNKKLVDPTKIEKWAVANFLARCDIRSLVRDLIKCGGIKGIKIDEPFDVFEENSRNRQAPPVCGTHLRPNFQGTKDIRNNVGYSVVAACVITSVVISSPVRSSLTIEKIVFHATTNKKTLAGMNSWFAMEKGKLGLGWKVQNFRCCKK
ncbi:hypothetical protein M8C21_025615 [Ambrosia artemisiifolia]|uniref:Protein argonaute Mid domain-containing protein n=1 Tax=Ambrosia artemisiifolia TaxID=4212 RepID=A0AAD5D5M6_AMBAR|nr:hypothetical protein M8C21_025615 [Ambrosia artemisiifolia]